ncbi:MAG TPA: hypothetical protein VMY88_07370 [Acidimicrobiales bacterium]|nr:hypothetical protein [Acidimicrobiales bacterium]
MRWEQQPPHPVDEDELSGYTDRLIAELERCCGERLACVLLCGSWARGEAEPPRSDVDMFVVVRTVDEETLGLLAEAWTSAGAGPSNVVGLDELGGLPRYGQEMVTTNAKVLWGLNPFSEPTRQDFAADLSDVADSLARTARCLLLYPWLTGEERLVMVERLTGKWGLAWAAKCLIAYRTGAFPEGASAVERELAGQPEGHLIQSLIGSAPRDPDQQRLMARTVNGLARTWLGEVANERS